MFGLTSMMDSVMEFLKTASSNQSYQHTACTFVFQKARKSRKSVSAGATDSGNDVISMGTATGNINLYSVTRGEIQAQLVSIDKACS